MTIVEVFSHEMHGTRPRGLFALVLERTNPYPRQFGSASAPTVTTEVGMNTEDRLGHTKNARDPMLVTPLGMEIDRRLMQWLKTPLVISVSELLRTTVARLWHDEKAFLPI